VKETALFLHRLRPKKGGEDGICGPDRSTQVRASRPRCRGLAFRRPQTKKASVLGREALGNRKKSAGFIRLLCFGRKFSILACQVGL